MRWHFKVEAPERLPSDQIFDSWLRRVESSLMEVERADPRGARAVSADHGARLRGSSLFTTPLLLRTWLEPHGSLDSRLVTGASMSRRLQQNCAMNNMITMSTFCTSDSPILTIFAWCQLFGSLMVLTNMAVFFCVHSVHFGK